MTTATNMAMPPRPTMPPPRPPAVPRPLRWWTRGHVMLVGIVLGGALVMAAAFVGVNALTGPSPAQTAAARAGAEDGSFMVYVIEHDPTLPTPTTQITKALEQLGHADCNTLAAGDGPDATIQADQQAADVAVLEGAVRYFCPQYRSKLP